MVLGQWLIGVAVVLNARMRKACEQPHGQVRRAKKQSLIIPDLLSL